MASRLVLVRHAKAQSRKCDIADEDRELTRAGVQSIVSSYPTLIALLADESPKKIHIWSSPAIRALQTAEVIAAYLDVKGIEVVESLYSDDYEPLLEMLEAQSGMVIAVGHNPFMEELVQDLAEDSMSFGKGAVASFDLYTSSEGEMHARLEWILAAPNVERWQTLDDIDEALVKASRRIKTNYEALLLNPNDQEALHQYRISLRVARSLLRFLKPYLKKEPLKEALDVLKELQDPTSKLRELDMLVEQLPRGIKEIPLCEKARAKERAEFIGKLDKKKTRKAVAHVCKLLNTIPWTKKIEFEGLEPCELAARVRVMERENALALENVDCDDINSIHDARKDAKLLRYVTRELKGCLPEHAGETRASAKAIQDKLGLFCDCVNNARLVQEICGIKSVGLSRHFRKSAQRAIESLKLDCNA